MKPNDGFRCTGCGVTARELVVGSPRMVERLKQSGITKVNHICKKILRLSDEDIAEVRAMIEGQQQYNHPLKGGTQIRQHKLARHNGRVLNQLLELRKTLYDDKETLR